MNKEEIALEAAWEFERLTADGRIFYNPKLVAIILAAIEKGRAELLTELGGKQYLPAARATASDKTLNSFPDEEDYVGY